MRLGGEALKFGTTTNPDCNQRPRIHPKQQQQQQQQHQPLRQQPQQQLLPQPQQQQQQQQRRPPRNMGEGKTGLTTPTTSTGDLVKILTPFFYFVTF